MNIVYFIVLIGLVGLFGGPIIAISAWRRTRDLEGRVNDLDKRLAHVLQGGRAEASSSPRAMDSAAERTVPDIGQEESPKAEAEVSAAYESAADALEKLEKPVATTARSSSKPEVTNGSVEEKLLLKWFVWIGGVAISLGGIFLVKYSIDHDLLSPVVRIGMGCILGAVLILLGEGLRRRPKGAIALGMAPAIVPPVLSGAGLLIEFGTIYAAHALYGMLHPLLAFGFLSAVAFGAFALALLQGTSLALLGILGAYLVPVLVPSEQPNLLGLVSYLTLVNAAALALARYRAWWRMGWSALIGTSLWTAFALLFLWQDQHTLSIGVFILANAALFMSIRFEAYRAPREPLSHPFDVKAWIDHEQLSAASTLFAAVAGFALIRLDGYGAVSLSVGVVLVLSVVAVAILRREYEAFSLAAAGFAVAVLSSWHLPQILDQRFVIGGAPAIMSESIITPEYSVFALYVAATAIVFFGTFVIAKTRSSFPQLWAAISASVPLLCLVIAKWRLGNDTPSYLWVWIAMLGAVSMTMMASWVSQKRLQQAMGIYVIVGFAMIVFAMTIYLEKSWLSVGLALMLPVAAKLNDQLRIPFLREVCFGLAIIVAVRLIAPNYLPWPILSGEIPIIEILYTFGVPSLCFAMAAHYFRLEKDDRVVTTLESLAIAAVVLTMNLALRSFIHGLGTEIPPYGLLEQGLHSTAWLISGLALLRRQNTRPRRIQEVAWKALLAAAALQTSVLQLFVSNPLISGEPLLSGTWGIELGVAYLLPSVMFAAVVYEAHRQHKLPLLIQAGTAAVILMFVFLTLFTRYIYQGDDIGWGAVRDAELYSYSLVWFAYSVVLLLSGMRFGVNSLRYASLGLMIMVIAKVFLWDMAGLSGLYRAASFLGLGICLVGMGYFYKRVSARIEKAA